jgi:hypothetical protein
MITIYGEKIPIEKWDQFNEILKATGGRYVGNPCPMTRCVLVSYEPGPETQARWARCNEDVKEVRKDQLWRRMLRRLGVKA